MCTGKILINDETPRTRTKQRDADVRRNVERWGGQTDSNNNTAITAATTTSTTTRPTTTRPTRSSSNPSSSRKHSKSVAKPTKVAEKSVKQKKSTQVYHHHRHIYCSQDNVSNLSSLNIRSGTVSVKRLLELK